MNLIPMTDKEREMSMAMYELLIPTIVDRLTSDLQFLSVESKVYSKEAGAVEFKTKFDSSVNSKTFANITSDICITFMDKKIMAVDVYVFDENVEEIQFTTKRVYNHMDIVGMSDLSMICDEIVSTVIGGYEKVQDCRQQYNRKRGI